MTSSHPSESPGSLIRYAVLSSVLCAIIGLPESGQAQTPREPMTPDERSASPVEQDERARQAAGRGTALERHDVRYDEEHRRPGELYVAGFGGYTFGHSFSNVQGTGTLAGTPLPGIDLKNSGVYGGKVGYFLPDRLNWLGFEAEAFNSSPNFKQSAIGPGASLRVTTLAFNAIIRGKFGCGPSRTEASRRTTTEAHTDPYGYRHDTFCAIQPYIGAGVGVFFAHTDGGFGTRSDSDNAVPGFNGLAGIRYFITEHIAVFGEYKYNRATLNFDHVAPSSGLKGDYSVSHVVGGLSFHF